MWYTIILSLLAVCSITAIRVPVDSAEDNNGAPVAVPNAAPNEPIYYVPDDVKLSTYLLPTDHQPQEEVILDVAPKPASYLLPPASGKQSDYYYDPTGTEEQSDWYPIAQLPQNSPGVVPIILPELNETEALKIIENVRSGKVLRHEQYPVPTPSTKLEPPAPNAPNDYVVFNSEEVELPGNGNRNSDIRRPVELNQNRYVPYLHDIHKSKLVDEPLQVLPHKTIPLHYKTPTKLYPKKYVDGFKPVPIPVSQFAEDSGEVPKARPLKPFHPILSVNNDYQVPSDEKKIYLYEQVEKKRKEKQEQLPEKYNSDETNEDLKPTTGEQQTSESHLRYPERDAYVAPLQDRRPTEIRSKQHPPPPPGERTEFRMHGMKGPHSYQFGYDTGKGKNRQFRYEERDNDGHVRGHYGYVGRNGKLRVVNYDADPEHGFRAQEPVEKDE